MTYCQSLVPFEFGKVVSYTFGGNFNDGGTFSGAFTIDYTSVIYGTNGCVDLAAFDEVFGPLTKLTMKFTLFPA